jgi:hypothetical protein
LFGATGEVYLAINKTQQSLLIEQESGKLLTESKCFTQPHFASTEFHIIVVIIIIYIVIIKALQPFDGPWKLIQFLDHIQSR